MLVRGNSITDISVIENVSIKKMLSVLVNSNRIITPNQEHYDSLEVDEFWTYVGNKKNKVWLLYAYHRFTGEFWENVTLKQPKNGIVKFVIFFGSRYNSSLSFL